jgi:NAD(P)-dependent dehydrogenase (short-subunit alcohol dehydrogenase family)
MPTVLVTGAARGIGRAISARLASSDWDVLAGVRRTEDAAAIGVLARVTPVTLDVTDYDQVAALAQALPDRLDAIVNNAGIVVSGPLESVPVAELRRQFEVNVVGQIAVTQAVLPKLRTSRGRIVFISSVNGKVASPMLGAYSASKFALEAAADALRMELRPWRIGVSVIEPAQTATDIWSGAEAGVDELEAAMTTAQRMLYARHIAGLRKSLPLARKAAVPADDVATVSKRRSRPAGRVPDTASASPRASRWRWRRTCRPRSPTWYCARPSGSRETDVHPFVRRNPDAPEDFFGWEAAGLQWLSGAEGGAVRAGAVLRCRERNVAAARFRTAGPHAAAQFGRGWRGRTTRAHPHTGRRGTGGLAQVSSGRYGAAAR